MLPNQAVKLDFFARENNKLSWEIRKRELLGELLIELGCKNVRCGQHAYRVACPIHAGDHQNLRILPSEPIPIIWACHSHHCEIKWRPSLLGFVRGALSAAQGQKEVGMKAAIDYLRTFLAERPSTRPKPQEKQPSKPVLLRLPQSHVEENLQLVMPSPFFLARGYSAMVLNDHLVGDSRTFDRKPLVPIFDDHGQTCIGHQARTIHPRCDTCRAYHAEGKSCRLGEPKWDVKPWGFRKSEYLYNLAAVRQDQRNFVVVVEGPGDAWRLQEAGFPAMAALGSTIYPAQEKKLRALKKRICVAFDNDDPGKKGMTKIPSDFEALPVPHGYHDAGGMSVDEVKRWLASSITSS